MAYTGRAVSAIEAKEMGLVNQVFDSHKALVEGIMSISAEIASKAPLAVYGCKRMINYAETPRRMDWTMWPSGMLHFQRGDSGGHARSVGVAPATLSIAAIRGGKTEVNLPRLFAQRTNKDPVQLQSSIQRQTLRRTLDKKTRGSTRNAR